MKFSDYLRLGVAGVLARKRRAALTIGVVATLVSVLVAGCLMVQGVENAALGEMTEAVDGKILLSVGVDERACAEECDIEVEEQKLREKIQEYGGKVVEAKTVANADGMFYRAEGVFEVGEVPEGETAVLVPMSTAARWLGIGMYAPGLKAADEVKIAERIRNETVGKIVETENGGRYFVADLLPGGAFNSTLEVSWVNEYNLLDLVLGQVETGGSRNFVVSGELEGIEVRAILAEFADIEKAEVFMQDPENDCTEVGQMFGECGKEYRYYATAVVSEPVATRGNLREVWVVYGVVCVVLMIIVVVIEMGAYMRLIEQDAKTIALYCATGATREQICGVYTVYLLMLSAIVVVAAGLIGVGLAVIVSMVNEEVLAQTFVLGFGIVARRIWLVGWNWRIVVMMVVVFMVVPVVILCSVKRFVSKNLAQKLK